MARSLWLIGIVCLGFAAILSFLASVSVPLLTGLDITRVTVGNPHSTNTPGVNDIRFGIWSVCEYDTAGRKTCTKASGKGYTTEVRSRVNGVVVTIGKSWTRGLVVHPIATAVIFAALGVAFVKSLPMMLLSFVLSFLAAMMSIIAWAIDLALLAFVHHEMNKLKSEAKATAGRGFWLNFISIILLIVAGFSVFFGYRRERSMSGPTSYPMM